MFRDCTNSQSDVQVQFCHGLVPVLYLGLSELSLQELQGLSVSLLTVLQGGQLLLHLPLQTNDKQQVTNSSLDLTVKLNSIRISCLAETFILVCSDCLKTKSHK